MTASDELDRVFKRVREDYDVYHMSNGQFSKISSDELIVFDVRKLQEYEVSHIKDAIHLDPGTSTDDFLKQHAGILEGKIAVLYCSVGKRSSRMLSMLNDRLFTTGVNQAYNLEGGAFKWHNDSKNFVNNDGRPTRDIHPYNAYWGRLVHDKSSVKYR